MAGGFFSLSDPLGIYLDQVSIFRRVRENRVGRKCLRALLPLPFFAIISFGLVLGWGLGTVAWFLAGAVVVASLLGFIWLIPLCAVCVVSGGMVVVAFAILGILATPLVLNHICTLGTGIVTGDSSSHAAHSEESKESSSGADKGPFNITLPAMPFPAFPDIFSPQFHTINTVCVFSNLLFLIPALLIIIPAIVLVAYACTAWQEMDFSTMPLPHASSDPSKSAFSFSSSSSSTMSRSNMGIDGYMFPGASSGASTSSYQSGSFPAAVLAPHAHAPSSSSSTTSIPRNSASQSSRSGNYGPTHSLGHAKEPVTGHRLQTESWKQTGKAMHWESKQDDIFSGESNPWEQ